jgi:hypothetical protein
MTEAQGPPRGSLPKGLRDLHGWQVSILAVRQTGDQTARRAQ